MRRFSVRIACGLAALLIAPSWSAAQVAPDLAKPVGGAAASVSANLAQPIRPFRGITFDGTPQAAPVFAPRNATRFDRLLKAQPPAAAVAPEPQSGVPCMMPVLPVDPGATSNMPVVKGDATIDTKMVVKAPPCTPQVRGRSYMTIDGVSAPPRR